MANYFLNKIGQVVFTLWGVSLVVFLILRLSPGDPAALMLPTHYTEEEYQSVRHALGLDKSLPEQYWIFITDIILRGDFGHSYVRAGDALSLVLERVPKTFVLAVGSMTLALLISIPLGAFMALHQGGWLDSLGLAFIMISQSAPSFAVGVLLVLIFAVKLGLLPATGYGGLRHLVLPCATLALLVAPVITQVTRTGLIEALREDYVRTAHAKGLSENRIVLKHALTATMMSIITMIGLQFGLLMAGTFVVEAVFAYPGIGQLLLESISLRDYPMIQATIMVSATIFMLVNMLVDLTYGLIDPRIRLKGQA